MSSSNRLRLAFASAFLLAATPAAGLEYTFTPLVFPGSNTTVPLGVNDHGEIVGYYRVGPGNRGFHYDGAAFFPIEFPGAYTTSPHAINDRGAIVGSYALEPLGDRMGFLLEDGVYTSFDLVEHGNVLDFLSMKLQSINAEGRITGYYTPGPRQTTDPVAFTLQDGVLEEFSPPTGSAWFLGGSDGRLFTGRIGGVAFRGDGASHEVVQVPGGSRVHPYGINDVGVVAGYYEDRVEIEGVGTVMAQRGFVRDADGVHRVDYLGPGQGRTLLYGINRSGTVVGFWSDSVENAATIGLIGVPDQTPASDCAEPAGFFGLGDLPGGPFESHAAAVSPDGQVVVGWSRSSGAFPGVEAFTWTREAGMEGLGFLPGDEHSRAVGVSADATVVVGDSGIDNSAVQAVRWEDGAPTGLGLLPGHDQLSTAVAVSDDGAVVAGTSSSSQGAGEVESFRWTQETGLVGLGGGQISIAEDMDAAGDVIVGWEWFPLASSCFQQAFRWESGVLANIADCGSYAGAVSGDGAVAFGENLVNGTYELMRVEGGVIETEGFIPGHVHIFPRGANADGSAVVGLTEETTGVPERAFLWDEEKGLRLLQDVLVQEYGLGEALAGWTLEEASDVTDHCSRVVVGRGTNPSGDPEAFYAVLPEPKQGTALAAGLVLLLLLHAHTTASRSPV